MGLPGRLRVAVGLSGGVDSCMAAHLLRHQGHDVVGVFMRNWDEREETGSCTTERDWNRAQAVAAHAGIPCVQADFVRQYWQTVFRPFMDQYARGLTPNPDVLCNHKVKFGAFLEYAQQRLGADCIATGHYARTNEQGCLLAARDPLKDQTYFLAGLPAAVLRKVYFPVGELFKTQVKDMACDLGLNAIANQPESMGICFIGKRDFKPFLANYLPAAPGPVVLLDAQGRPVGELGMHEGMHLHTLGQRLHLPGQSARTYVVGKVLRDRILLVAQNPLHPALFTSAFAAADMQWTMGTPEGLHPGMVCLARTRHQQALFSCHVAATNTTTARASSDAQEIWAPGSVGYVPPEFRTPETRPAPACVQVQVLGPPMRAVTPGQWLVLYDKTGDVCLGGGILTDVIYNGPCAPLL